MKLNFRRDVLLILFLIFTTLIIAVPKVDYDWHTPEKNISTIALGLGGLNQIYPEDYFVAYSNPSLLALRSGSYFSSSFRSRRMDEKPLNDILSPSYLLHKKQFVYYTFSAPKFAFSYQPIMDINTSVSNDTLNTYHDLYMNCYTISLAASDETYKNLTIGFNLKFLNGRQIYNKNIKNNNLWEAAEFVDDSAIGYAVDLGLSYHKNTMLVGLTLHDVVSKIYWDEKNDTHLRQRYSFGAGFYNEKSTFSVSTQGRFNQPDESTYHIGYGYSLGLGKSATQSFGFKTGLYGSKFDKMKNMYYTLGIGYTVSMFRVDISAISKGFTARNTDYLFSITVGR